MKNIFVISAVVVAGILLVIGLISMFDPHQETSLPPIQKHLEWGAYTPEPAELHALEQKVGKTADIGAAFASFDEGFPQEFVDSVGSPTTTPLIFLETPDGSNLKDVINGDYDASLRDFAAKAKAFGNKIILVPFNEPNLNESAWGFGTSRYNTAENFKKAWVHVHDLFADAPNVKWGLAYNNVSIPQDPNNTFENLYPGPLYVDYVGVDGFNWQEDGQWQTLADTLATTTHELVQFNKPIYLFSIGTGEDTAGNPALKAQWISDLFAWIKAHHEVNGFVWFNEDKLNQGEKNWLLDSNTQALEAFKAGLAQY